MTQTSIAPYPRFRAFYPGTSNPLAGGQLWTLQPGTSGTGFLKATYTDSTGQTANSNPVILDANGEADVWLSGYTKLVLQDASGVQVWSVDNVSSMPNTAPPGQSEWVAQNILLTYVSATQFSTLGDQTAMFLPEQRVQAIVAAGTIYGTVSNSVASGSPVTTTVTVIWDAGQLDSGLSAISTGIITASAHTSLPGGSVNFLTGEFKFYGRATPPTGWLLCDGSSVSRTTYAALFAILGTAYGAGDGSTTFNLPDGRGRMPVGAGQATPPIWLASTAYALNSIVKPTASYNYVYEAISSAPLTFTWANGSPGYDTFTSSGVNISSAINTAGSSESASGSLSGLVAGHIYALTFILTQNSGQKPTLTATGGLSLSQQLAAGSQTMLMTATATTGSLTLNNTAAANFSVSGLSLVDVTAAGTSGTTEPTWPATIGATVADGTITWACRAKWTNRALGSYGGEETHTQALSELVPITPLINDPGRAVASQGTNQLAGGPTSLPTLVQTGPTGITISPIGGGLPMNIMNPFFTGYWIVKT